MKIRVVLMLAFLVGFACVAMADDIKIPNDTPYDPPRTVCPETDYMGYLRSEGITLSVNDQFYTVGPIDIPGTCLFDDIMIDLDISATWVGDVIAEVYYDSNGDGTPEAGPVSVLCRPNLAGCSVEGCCGCSGDLNGVYRFAEAGTEALGDPNCPSSFPTGNCYLPAPESQPFSIFDGQASGGKFWMQIADCAAGDTTTLRAWKVWVKCAGPVPADGLTWGQIKSIYR